MIVTRPSSSDAKIGLACNGSALSALRHWRASATRSCRTGFSAVVVALSRETISRMGMQRRKQKNKKQRDKRGKPYEGVVTDVFRLFDPSATVQRGKWVVGAYGRRELDVLIEGTVDGIPRRAIIECKDYNPKTTGPVGVEIVDALVTKRRLVGADVALLCSNAGFTSQAIREAQGEGIGMISVMRAGDPRIRYQVREEIYTRRIKVDTLNVTLHTDPPLDPAAVPSETITFRGAPIENWIVKRVWDFTGANPIVAGAFTATHKLKEPVPLGVPSGSVTLTQIDFTLRLSGGWFAHQVTLDAAAGIYDWLKRRVRLTPGPGHFDIQNVDVMNGGEAIDRPPQSELNQSAEFGPGELSVKLMSFTGPGIREPIPPIDELIVPEDLSLRLPDLPPAASTSSTPSS